MSDQRLIELETRIAFQEDTIQQLSDVIYRQQKQIDKLEQICKLLGERLQEMATGDFINPSPADEKPPHY